MIIHSPIISGSLTFADGATFTLPSGGNYNGTFTGTINSTNGVISGSSQVNADSIINFDDNVKEKLNLDGVISGSSQVNADSITNFDSNVKDKLNVDGVISGSSQISLSGFDTDDLSEGSTNLYYLDTRVKTKLNTETVISGSSQVSLTSTTGYVANEHIDHTSVSITAGNGLTGGGTIASTRTLDIGQGDGINVSADSIAVDSTVLRISGYGVVTGSAQITLSGDITGAGNNTQIGTGVIVNADVNASAAISHTKLNFGGSTILSGSLTTQLPSGVISGSSQVNADSITNFDSNVKDKLNVEAVVSGSTQILTLVSIDEDNMVSNSDTKLPTQQSVKAYVDSEISNLVASAPGTLDTLNELAAALGDDPNFATTISTTIGGKVSQSLEIISGNGLTGGGNLTTNRTLAVGGTADRISVSADAVDIAATYVGQSSITTLGTIGTGTWNGSVIASAYLDADTAHLTTTQTFSGAKTFSAVTTISNSTASTSKTTGALVVTGGVGVSGDVNVGGDVVAYASSDERLKDNIELISNPIEKVQSLKGVTWSWNDLASETQKLTPSVGVIAQDVEKVLPQLVHDRDNGFKGVDYAKLTGLLIEAIKEQQKQIDELKSKLS